MDDVDELFGYHFGPPVHLESARRQTQSRSGMVELVSRLIKAINFVLRGDAPLFHNALLYRSCFGLGQGQSCASRFDCKKHKLYYTCSVQTLTFIGLCNNTNALGIQPKATLEPGTNPCSIGLCRVHSKHAVCQQRAALQQPPYKWAPPMN